MYKAVKIELKVFSVRSCLRTNFTRANKSLVLEAQLS